ncbi:hypothetical protein HKCCE2091_11035 [Rhodobacterales bacterium HKCCE2091]|nr:hypothetical protein [Rhodobacterales bacterium HKCCE2091]
MSTPRQTSAGETPVQQARREVESYLGSPAWEQRLAEAAARRAEALKRKADARKVAERQAAEAALIGGTAAPDGGADAPRTGPEVIGTFSERLAAAKAERAERTAPGKPAVAEIPSEPDPEPVVMFRAAERPATRAASSPPAEAVEAGTKDAAPTEANATESEAPADIQATETPVIHAEAETPDPIEPPRFLLQPDAPSLTDETVEAVPSDIAPDAVADTPDRVFRLSTALETRAALSPSVRTDGPRPLERPHAVVALTRGGRGLVPAAAVALALFGCIWLGWKMAESRQAVRAPSTAAEEIDGFAALPAASRASGPEARTWGGVGGRMTPRAPLAAGNETEVPADAAPVRVAALVAPVPVAAPDPSVLQPLSVPAIAEPAPFRTAAALLPEQSAPGDRPGPEVSRIAAMTALPFPAAAPSGLALAALPTALVPPSVETPGEQPKPAAMIGPGEAENRPDAAPDLVSVSLDRPGQPPLPMLGEPAFLALDIVPAAPVLSTARAIGTDPATARAAIATGEPARVPASDPVLAAARSALLAAAMPEPRPWSGGVVRPAPRPVTIETAAPAVVAGRPRLPQIGDRNDLPVDLVSGLGTALDAASVTPGAASGARVLYYHPEDRSRAAAMADWMGGRAVYQPAPSAPPAGTIEVMLTP